MKIEKIIGRPVGTATAEWLPYDLCARTSLPASRTPTGTPRR
jgi:hypothetical protein